MLDQPKPLRREHRVISLLLLCLFFIGVSYAQPVISSFTLINSNTDSDIGLLQDGDTLILNLLPSINLNVRANTIPSPIDRVTFDYDGILGYASEGVMPYAFAGDNNGNYKNWTPSAGAHTMTATPKQNGVNGTPYTVNFFVIASAAIDCNGDVNGFAYPDDCGICVGGNTGLQPNLDKDTCGVCFGNDSSCIGGNTGGGIVNSGLVCGNFPGGRIAMASDGNTSDADDHGASAFAIAMLHYAGLLDQLVYVGHSSLYKSPCKYAYGNWCDRMDTSSVGTLKRFGGDTGIVYSYKEDYDDNNQLDQSITAFTAAIDASSPGDSLWIYCAGPMDVVYRAINNASPSKRAYVKCISHSTWNENSLLGGLSYKWAAIKQDFTVDGVQFYEIRDQNNSNGNLDFAQESDSASNWDWMTQSGNADWIWLRNTNLDIWLETTVNKAFDISDAGMMYWLISGGPNGGCDTCGARQVENLFNNPCSDGACDSNILSTVNIIAPNDSDVFAVNTSVSVVAGVLDPDSNTAYVEFYAGASLQGIDSTNTYSFNITGLDTGYHEIYVKAVDTCGESSFNDTIVVIVQAGDCAGSPGGTAYLDDCGICVGGTTGLLPNLDKDTCGVCFGNDSSCIGGNTGGGIVNSGLVCGNFPGGRIAMASDGNTSDADDQGASAFAIAMLHYAGLLDQLVYVGHSSLYKSPCKYAYGNWCDLMDTSTVGTLKRFGGDTGIVYSYKEDYDDNNQLDQSITAFTAAIDASSPGDSLWIYCAGPMDVVYRAIENADSVKRSYVKCISHSTWNENSVDGGLSYKWADLKSDFTADGVTFYDIIDQNNSNGKLDFAQESDSASNWDWMTQSGNADWIWLRNTNLDIWLETTKNKAFDISDAGMMYWLISGGPNGGCDTCGARQVENLFNNPCSDGACDSNILSTVNIIAPNDSDVFAVNTSVSVVAGVLDPDSNTAYVEFYAGASLQGIDSTNTYSFNITGLDTGYHEIYVKAVDTCGESSFNDTIVVIVQAGDCAGSPGGTAYLDDCGICVGGTTGLLPNLDKDTCGVCFGDDLSCVPVDCNGDTNGTAVLDSCGICASGNTGVVPNESCRDCNGDINGTASFDTCGVCSGGATGATPGNSCSDCNGDPFGKAGIDLCDVCSGGATGIAANTSCLDCNNELNGSAAFDNCDICSGGSTGLIPDSSCTDCNGVLNGTAAVDTCGVCAGGNTGIIVDESCVTCVPNQVVSFTLMEDGLGGPIKELVNGDVIYTTIIGSFSIRADICNSKPVGSVVFTLNGDDIRNENTAPYSINGDNSNGYKAWNPGAGTYTLTATPYSNGNGGGTQGVSKTVTFSISTNTPVIDCYGDIAGTASVDLCGVCSGGNTGLTPNATCIDCNGVVNGTAAVDACGICAGGTTGIPSDSTCMDCSGVANGTAVVDSCGECVLGNTGLAFNSSCNIDCNGVVNGTALIDGCNVCAGGNTGITPDVSCTDCAGVVNGTALIDGCNVCAGGNTGITADVSCTDCAGIPNGTASADTCGICSGGNTGLFANASCTDCAGVVNGSAAIDTCNVCAGGSTGVIPNTSCASCVPNQVVALVLMEAGSSGVSLGPINNGDVIVRSVVGPFSIDAQVCDDAAVESVIYSLNGNFLRNENAPPYAINGDNGSSNFKSWNISDGVYTVTATPFSSNNANGTMGVPLSVTFTVLDQGGLLDCNGDINGSALVDLCGVCAGGNTGVTANASCRDCNDVINGSATVDSCGLCAGGNTGIVPNSFCSDCSGVPNGTASIDSCNVCSGGTTGITPNSGCGSACSSNEVITLMLIDASVNQDIAGLSNGDIIDLSILPNFSVRADVCSEPDVESVVFKLNGNSIRTENATPYSVNGGAYAPWPLSPGSYTLKATPYSGNSASGNAGIAKTVTFTVINGTPAVDCNGVVGGSAYLDACNFCVGGNTGDLPCVPTAGCGEFIEQGGLVVVELESVPTTHSDWYVGAGPIYDFSTLTDISGSYYMWKENCVSGSSSPYSYNSCGGTTSGGSIQYISYIVSINQPGRYRFQMRSWQTNEQTGNGNPSTENNDFWLRLPNGGGIKKKGGSEISIGTSEDVKIYQNKTKQWVWISSTVDNSPHEVYIDIPAAGSYEIEIGGRSNLLAMDRFVLYLSDNPSNNITEGYATSMDRSESSRGSCDGGAAIAAGSDPVNGNQQQGQLGDNPSTVNFLGVDETVSMDPFQVLAYPNPTTGKLNLSILRANAEAIIEIYDATGRLILKRRQTGEHNVIDLSAYPNGIYWVKTRSGESLCIEKIYKK